MSPSFSLLCYVLRVMVRSSRTISTTRAVVSSPLPHLHFSELEGEKKEEGKGKQAASFSGHDQFYMSLLFTSYWLELCHIVIPSCKKGLEMDSLAVWLLDRLKLIGVGPYN